MSELELNINGTIRTVAADPHRPLRDVLREDLGLTGTKDSCSSGVCGACTVLVDGRARKSCLVPAGKAEGHRITTIEGVGSADSPDVVQRAFDECFASQCGYCMPGFVMAAESMLAESPSPTRDEIRDGIRGNLCRCTGYTKIVAAVDHAATAKEGQEPGSREGLGDR
jgi:carbon-monoxide dehydrogenase small subunit